MKIIPLVLLALMAGVFMATLPWGRTGWQGYFHAFAEAAMIGALADWFAVTALFRRPMGLPIPHTAIIPARKDEIGRSLARFVSDNFLTPQAIRRRLAETSLAGHLTRWLQEPAVQKRASGLALGFAAWLTGTVRSQDVRDFLRRLGERQLHSLNPAPLAGQALAFLIRDGRHQKLFTVLLRQLVIHLNDNREEIRRRVADGSPWWMPGFIDDRMVVQMIDRIEGQLLEMTLDPDHDMRQHFSDWLADLAHRLETDPEYREMGEAMKKKLLTNPVLTDYAAGLWSDLTARLEDAAENPDDPLRAEIERLLANTARELESDPAMRARVDGWLELALVTVVAENRNAISGLISDTVGTWDAQATARRVELEIGKDLQYIRVSGTIVGGLIGITIHALVQAFYY